MGGMNKSLKVKLCNISSGGKKHLSKLENNIGKPLTNFFFFFNIGKPFSKTNLSCFQVLLFVVFLETIKKGIFRKLLHCA